MCKKMNNKGFTLTELLATIVILSLVLGIASYSIVNIIKNSREKSEAIFVDKISTAIDEYIGLEGSNLIEQSNAGGWKVSKCNSSNCSSSTTIDIYEVSGVNLGTLISEGYLNDNKLVNPVNKLNCLEDGKNPLVRIFKDADYVYYYYVDLSGDNTSCEISSENGIINTLPGSDKLSPDFRHDNDTMELN